MLAPPAYSPLLMTLFGDAFGAGEDGLVCGAGGHTMHWNGFRPVSTSVDLGVLWCRGVGVAVGRSPQYGKNSPFIMVLLGTRHAAPKAVGKVKRKK